MKEQIISLPPSPLKNIIKKIIIREAKKIIVKKITKK